MPHKEIITIQLGQTANYVGAHLWNLQEEAFAGSNQDHPGCSRLVDARQAEVNGTPTYAPRVLAVDLRGSLGGSILGSSLSRNSADTPTTWDHGVEVHRTGAGPINTTPPQAAPADSPQSDVSRQAGAGAELASAGEDRVQRQAAGSSGRPQAMQSWTDYLAANLTPSSVWQLPGIWHGSPDFLGFGNGRELLEGGSLLEEFQDRIRVLAEECDFLQGFRILVDDSSGFGGMAAAALPHLQEDYLRTPTFIAALQSLNNPITGQAGHTRVHSLNECLSLSELAPAVDLYCPLSAPARAAWPTNSLFHSSAICAVLLDQVMLPTRLQPHSPGHCDLHSLSQLLSTPTSIVATALSFPCPPASRLPSGSAPFTSSATASCTPGLSFEDWKAELLAESVVLRCPPPLEGSAGAALDRALQAEGLRALRHRHATETPVRLPLNFPLLSVPDGSRPSLATRDASVLTRLASSSAAQKLVQQGLASFKGLSKTPFGGRMLDKWSYDSGEREEIQEKLYAQIRAYEPDSD